MDKRTKTSRDVGNWIGVGTAINFVPQLAAVEIGAAIGQKTKTINSHRSL